MANVMRSRGAAGDEYAIAALVQQTAASYEVVKELYYQEFAALRAEAKVENFLGIIASRRVRQRLRATAKAVHVPKRDARRAASMHIVPAQQKELPRIPRAPDRLVAAAQA